MNTDRSHYPSLHQRWMIRRDMEEVMAIEAESDNSWEENDFFLALRERHIIGWLAEKNARNGPVLAFMVYGLKDGHIELLKLAIAAKARRCGIGRRLIEKLIGKLSSHRRTAITVNVPDGNLAAQLFFRDQGFRAVRVCHGDDGDSYLMRYLMPREAPSMEMTWEGQEEEV